MCKLSNAIRAVARPVEEMRRRVHNQAIKADKWVRWEYTITPRPFEDNAAANLTKWAQIQVLYAPVEHNAVKLKCKAANLFDSAEAIAVKSALSLVNSFNTVERAWVKSASTLLVHESARVCWRWSMTIVLLLKIVKNEYLNRTSSFYTPRV